jgi:hypothetical protein
MVRNNSQAQKRRKFRKVQHGRSSFYHEWHKYHECLVCFFGDALLPASWWQGQISEVPGWLDSAFRKDFDFFKQS